MPDNSIDSPIFTPVTFGPMTLRNRVIRSAAFENMAYHNRPSQDLYNYHVAVARGGVGMTTVCPAAIATPLYNLDDRLMKIVLRTGIIRTPKWLVKRALRGMFRKRRVVSPGFMNVYLPLLIGLLPGPVIARLWKKFKRL